MSDSSAARSRKQGRREPRNLFASLPFVLLSLALFWPMGHVGLALATAIAAWLNAAALFVLLRRRGFLALDGRFKGRLPRMLLASLAMGGLLWFAAEGLAGWFEADVLSGILALTILVGAGLGLYAVLALVFGAAQMGEVKALFARRRSS